MKYIKRFNEEVSYTYGNDMVFLKSLEDDIESIFVQVLDDGWVLDYQLTDYAGNIGWVRLKKESGGESKTIGQLLPYLHHFYDYIKSKGYDFHHIDLFGWICVDYDISNAYTIKKCKMTAINFGRKNWNFIEQHLIAVANRRLVSSITMNLNHNFTSKDRTNSYNESNSEGLNEEEVRDFCETHLVYLLDDGLRVLVSRDYKVTLSFRLVANNRWGQIKDQFISFLTHLRNEYHFLSNRPDRFDSYNLEFNIIPEGYGSYPDFFNIDDIISEKIDSHRLRDDYKILSIQFKIKGKK